MRSLPPRGRLSTFWAVTLKAPLMNAANPVNPATLNPDSRVVAIDIGGTLTKIGLVQASGTILEVEVLETHARQPFARFKDRLAAVLGRMRQQSGQQPPLAIGVGAPNASAEAGTMVTPPNFGWGPEIPLVRTIQEIWDLPVILTNDANAAALGEFRFGVARGMQHFVTLTLGTGLGSGIISHGKLLTGHNGMAGELGHLNVYPEGRQCNCGLKGCLETYASVTGIRRTISELIAERTEPSALRGVSFEQLTGAAISRAALEGDRLALEAFRITAEILGIKMADMVAHLDPEAFVISGGLSQAGDILLEPLQASMERKLFPVYRGKVKVLVSAHGSQEAVLGPAALAFAQLEAALEA